MPTDTVASPASAPSAAPASAPSAAPSRAPAPAVKQAPAARTQTPAQKPPGSSTTSQPTTNSTTPSAKPATGPRLSPEQRAKALLDSRGISADEPAAQTPAPQPPTAQPTQTTASQPQAPQAGNQANVAPTQDPASELMALRRSNSDMGRQFAQVRQQLGTYQTEMQKLMQERDQQRQQAAQFKLKPFEVGHPEQSRNQARIDRVEHFDASVAGALEALPAEMRTNEAAAQIRNRIAAKLGVTNEDLKLRDEFKAHTEEHNRKMATDPTYFQNKVAEVARREAQTLFQQEHMKAKAHQEVSQLFNQPHVTEFRKDPKNAQDFAKAVNDGVPAEYAEHMVRLYTDNRNKNTQLQEMANRIRELEEKSGMVTEQQRLVRARSAVTREPATQTIGDPYKVAKAAWNPKTNGPAIMQNPKFLKEVNRLRELQGAPPSA